MDAMISNQYPRMCSIPRKGSEDEAVQGSITHSSVRSSCMLWFAEGSVLNYINYIKIEQPLLTVTNRRNKSLLSVSDLTFASSRSMDGIRLIKSRIEATMKANVEGLSSSLASTQFIMNIMNIMNATSFSLIRTSQKREEIGDKS